VTNNNWQLIHSLNDIEPELQKQIFAHSSNPFTSLAFLLALEQTQCIGESSGWIPHYFLYKENLYTENQSQEEQASNNDEQSTPRFGLFISYLKTHSYGEYVFDWAWAEAYQRNGLNYYPKLLAGVPFSPIPCSKWLTNTSMSELDAFEHIRQFAVQEFDISSSHYIFPDKRLLIPVDDNKDTHWIEREGHQFHWFNEYQDGNLLTDFEQYLSLMTARKRKNILKERKKVRDAGVTTQWRSGSVVSDLELETFYQCYQSTYYKRRQTGYLNPEFFQQICRTMLDQVQILFCFHDDEIIAAALYIISNDTLYGRYWGEMQEHEILHFEACYYQGIEYCINNKLKTFNPGTQGEHKISRGFKPITTYSYHQIELVPFHQAIENFCLQEKQQNKHYMQACETRLPFKTGD
jgi:predicted N-acyltransferase